MPSIKVLLKASLAAGAIAGSVNIPTASNPLTLTAIPSKTLVSSSRRPTSSATVAASVAAAPQQTTGCAAIALQQEAAFAKNSSALLSDIPRFAPSLAFACLQSIPLDAAAAVEFIDWLKPYLQFQSTVGWLKNPPPSYQQPAVDLIGGLDAISAKVSGNQYKSEYEFEAAVAQLMQQAHEGHLSVPMPAYVTFVYYAPWEFISYSSDGVQLPKVYVESDRKQAANFKNLTWTPSPVVTINGQNSVDFLTIWMKGAAQGSIEPNADYNSVFPNAARLIDNGDSGVFTGYPIYPGNDNMSITFANGTSLGKAWGTQSRNLLVGVRSGQDFYDKIVSPPDEFEVSDEDDSPTTIVTAPRLPAPYPAPAVVQKGLGNGGFCSGYFLNQSSIAVLSIPSFEMVGPFSLTFQQFVTEFLQKAKASNMKKLVIDLQGNGGGVIFEGLDLFRQLFPTIDPFFGNTLRATATLNVVGQTLGQSNDTFVVNNPLYYKEDYVDANGKSFSSWQALFGPQQSRGDNFTNPIRYNTRNGADLGNGFIVSGYGNNTNIAPAYFAAKDILLLHDGYCASTCALFSETMKTEAGVKSVVVGGLPVAGPMQGVAGTKGANILDVGGSIPDEDLLYAAVEESVLLNLTLLFDDTDFPDVLSLLDDPSINVNPSKVSVNLRNQVRKSDPVTPLQFVYEASDCRIWYTAANLKSYEVLWQNAADALWGNGSLCVSGSTNQPSSKQNVTSLTTGPTSGSTNATGTGSKPNFVTASGGATFSWGVGATVLAACFAFAGAFL